MKFRDDFPCLLISLGDFQAFDHYQEIEESISEEWNLQPGDLIRWECADFFGRAEVIRRQGATCVIKKFN